MNRRGFLMAMFAAAAAPAICKAENLMKIAVPAEKKIILGRGFTRSMVYVDEFAFSKMLAGDFDGDVVMYGGQSGYFPSPEAHAYNARFAQQSEFGELLFPSIHVIGGNDNAKFGKFGKQPDLFNERRASQVKMADINEILNERARHKRSLITIRS